MTRFWTHPCIGCGKNLPTDRFGEDRRRSCGLKARCRLCLSEYESERWQRNIHHCRSLHREASKRYVASNKEKVYEQNRKRDALIRGAGSSEDFTRQEIWERDEGICHLCSKPCEDRVFDLDHIVPVSRGGGHTRDNVAVSHPTCNRSKGNRWNEEASLS